MPVLREMHASRTVCCDYGFPGLQSSRKKISVVTEAHLVSYDLCIGSERVHSLRSSFGLAFPNMFPSEQKLAIQVAGLDGVHIDLCAH